MKKIFLKRLPVVLLGSALVWASGCNDSLTYDDVNENAPAVVSFTPEQGPIGTVITIEGTDLHLVDEVLIGGQAVAIKDRVSNTEMSIIAAIGGKTGEITLSNRYGSGNSASAFTYTYPAPTITVAALAKEREVSSTLVIPGANLGSVSKVYFKAPGQTAVAANVVKSTLTEIETVVPFIDGTSAAILLEYYNGTSSVLTPESGAPVIAVTNSSPTVTTNDYSGNHRHGTTFKLSGYNLEKIEKVLVGGKEANILAQASAELTFVIPSDFAEGLNTLKLAIVFANGTQTQTLTEAFVVEVEKVYYWTNITSWGQGQKNAIAAYKDNYQYSSFFVPQTGNLHANSEWGTLVDAVSLAEGGAVCSASNVSKLPADKYNSVLPYFFFSGVSQGHLQVNSPANSASQLRNFYDGYGGKRVTDDQSIDWYGTPMLTFRYLRDSEAAEKKIADKVKAGTLEIIDEASFPIDAAANTVAGIVVNESATPAIYGGTLNSQAWAPNYTPKSDADNYKVDAVLMVLYHALPGPSGEGNAVKNVKRIGFIHIKSANIRATKDSGNPRYSDVTYNVYWQKYDYDHSK